MAINNKINPYQWKVKFQITVVPTLQQNEAVGLYKFEVFNHKIYVTVEYETKSFKEGIEVANKHKNLIQNLMLERMIYQKHFGNLNIKSELELLNENDLANAGLQTTPPVGLFISSSYDTKDNRKILTISHNYWKSGFKNKSKGYETDVLRIADWLQRSKEETDEINSFILAWIAFNGLYGLFASITGKKGDDASKFEHIIRELLVNDARNIENSSALSKLESYGILSNDGNTNWSDKLKAERGNINKDDINVLLYAMRCIYGVRKQVFHEAPQPVDIIARANTCKSILLPVAATCLKKSRQLLAVATCPPPPNPASSSSAPTTRPARENAEELLRHLHGDRYEVESAGTLPTEVNPLAVRAMAERGVDQDIAKIEKDSDDLVAFSFILSPQEKLFQLQKPTLIHEAQGDPRRRRGRGVHSQLSGTSWLPFSRRYRRGGP